MNVFEFYISVIILIEAIINIASEFYVSCTTGSVSVRTLSLDLFVPIFLHPIYKPKHNYNPTALPQHIFTTINRLPDQTPIALR